MKEMPAISGPNNRRVPPGKRTRIAIIGAKNIRKNASVQRPSKSGGGIGKVESNSIAFEEK
jgi:hypothetical protein